MGSAFFHEDDYCQVELLPASTRGYCLAEMGRIDEFAAAHYDGAGFTDIYLRGEAPAPVDSLGITLAEWESAIAPLLPRFTQVLTGYSSYRVPCQSVAGWGFGDEQAMFASVSEAGVIGPVWLALHEVLVDQVGLWCEVLRSLPRASDLVIADWTARRVLSLADEPGLAAYLKGEPDAASDHGEG